MDAAAWDARYEGGQVWSVEPNRFVVAELADLSPGRALDVAAGEGRNAIWLAEQGWSVVAVDFSKAGIAKAERLGAERGVEVDWVCADVLTYEPPAPFDLVLVCYLHLPAEQWAQVLATSVAALRPGGTLVIIGHDRSNIADGHGGPQDPAILTTPPEIVDQLGEAVTVERAEVLERQVDAHVALDHLVRAVKR
ncbi:MAG: class I SAM-dependent methyltransferase [Actinomycetota bacterium]|nr:class I SAM-dependent methyltransferase [Actinomycetota bacterium]